MASILVTRTCKLTQHVRTSLEFHGGPVGAELNELFKIMLPAEASSSPTPNYIAVMNSLAQYLAASERRMVDSDAVHTSEVVADAAVRAERDEAINDLNSSLVGLRSTVQGIHGDQAVTLLKLSGSNPTNQDHLVRYGLDVVAQLRDATIVLQAAQIEALALNRESIADELAVKTARVEKALLAIVTEARKRQQTQNDRNRKTEAHRSALLAVGQVTEALFRFAGRRDLADYVRPAVSRSQRPDAGGDEALPEPPPSLIPSNDAKAGSASESASVSKSIGMVDPLDAPTDPATQAA